MEKTIPSEPSEPKKTDAAKMAKAMETLKIDAKKWQELQVPVLWTNTGTIEIYAPIGISPKMYKVLHEKKKKELFVVEDVSSEGNYFWAFSRRMGGWVKQAFDMAHYSWVAKKVKGGLVFSTDPARIEMCSLADLEGLYRSETGDATSDPRHRAAYNSESYVLHSMIEKFKGKPGWVNGVQERTGEEDGSVWPVSYYGRPEWTFQRAAQYQAFYYEAVMDPPKRIDFSVRCWGLGVSPEMVKDLLKTLGSGIGLGDVHGDHEHGLFRLVEWGEPEKKHLRQV